MTSVAGSFGLQILTSQQGTRTLVNFLMGTMVNGTGPENIIFPTNGSVSNLFKDATIVSDALEEWYLINSWLIDKVELRTDINGNIGNAKSIVQNGFMHPETMLGSSTVTIKPLNEKEILITIFNVTSLTSGDFEKHLPWNEYPLSVVRDPSSSSVKNRYGNISQTYSFTLPIDDDKLKK
jgi:hypothetical protein